MLALACAERRASPAAAPVYEDEIDGLLTAHCGECHAADRALGGYRVDTYGAAIACVPGDARGSVVQPPAPRAPLLWTLRYDSEHPFSVPDGGLPELRAWVLAGAPLRSGGVHGGQVLMPGAPGFHGRLAARDAYGPLRDADHPWACGQCHADAPAGPEGVSPAPGASSCSSCHGEPGGALACGTCHGQGARAYPPQDTCFHADRGGAHAVHVEGVGAGPPLVCADCHPAANERLTGTHADGEVQVALRAPAAWQQQGPGDYDYDPETGRCAVYCHAQRGSLPEPVWAERGQGLDCGSCHPSPPPEHYAGPCSRCHAEADAEGRALVFAGMHVNGRVDLGTGGGGDDMCGACHGTGAASWPDTPSHRAHMTTSLTDSIACATCHVVPDTVTADGHLDRGDGDPAEVRLATDLRLDEDGPAPSYEDGRCSNLQCHGAARGDNRGLLWDQREQLGCGGCHGAPPPAPHPADPGCAQLHCHGSEVGLRGEGLAITAEGRARHVDGVIQHGESQ